jgi:hypothetical protein
MATQSESSSEQSDIQCQEHGCTSPLAETDVVRSRTWSEDITRTWNAPVHSLESLEERKEVFLHINNEMNFEFFVEILSLFSINFRPVKMYIRQINHRNDGWLRASSTSTEKFMGQNEMFSKNDGCLYY